MTKPKGFPRNLNRRQYHQNIEINKLNTELEKIAPNAFVVMHTVKDTKGGMIKKRPLKH